MQAFPKKRLKGFEPSTFCMAIRPISDPGGSEYRQLQGFRSGVGGGRDRECARMCGAKQAFGHPGARVPEI
jgi:hypothetical protein